MSTLTFADVLGARNITVPDDTLAELEVPVLTGPQRQGDVGIFPTDSTPAPSRLTDDRLVPATGIQVVRGEATGNTHELVAADGPVFWLPSADQFGDVAFGTLHVPAGSTAYLIHTDEHGANGVGPGTYVLHGKREMAEEIRRVAD